MGKIRDSERTRKRILDAAAKEVAAKGIEGTSVSDIARRARVSKQLVHHHFGSRDGLIEEVQDVKLRAVYEWPESISEQARDLFAERFRTRAQHLDDVRFLTWEAARGRSVPLNDIRERRMTGYGLAIRVMQAEGRLRPDFDPRLVQLATLALSTYPLAFAQITKLVTGRAPTDPAFQREWYEFLQVLGAAIFGAARTKARKRPRRRSVSGA